MHVLDNARPQNRIDASRLFFLSSSVCSHVVSLGLPRSRVWDAQDKTDRQSDYPAHQCDRANQDHYSCGCRFVG